jgi:hypothetical protein
MHDDDFETITQRFLVNLVFLRECGCSPEYQESGNESDDGSAVHCVLLWLLPRAVYADRDWQWDNRP